MTEECICIGSPDAVDKVNWKCVECKRDLKTDIERVFIERELVVIQKDKEALKRNVGQLTEEQIKTRRELNNE